MLSTSIQYLHEFTLNDSEFFVLKDMVRVYKDFVHKEIGDEIKAPYWARLQSVKQIEKIIHKLEQDTLK